jgi:hypothetical protein
MLGTKAELKKTRFYQEIQEETLAQFLPMLLRSGMSIQEIAKEAKIPIKHVKEIAKNCGIKVRLTYASGHQFFCRSFNRNPSKAGIAGIPFPSALSVSPWHTPATVSKYSRRSTKI